MGGGVSDPAVAPVVDGPDAMLLPGSHLRHVSGMTGANSRPFFAPLPLGGPR